MSFMSHSRSGSDLRGINLQIQSLVLFHRHTHIRNVIVDQTPGIDLVLIQLSGKEYFLLTWQVHLVKAHSQVNKKCGLVLAFPRMQLFSDISLMFLKFYLLKM